MSFVSSTALVDNIANALDDVRSSLTDQVDRFATLITQVEMAGRLARRGRTELALLTGTLAGTAELKKSIMEQRALVAELRSKLKQLMDRTQPHP